MSKTVVITGARKGIGRFLAEQYLAKGCKVIGLSRRDSDLEHELYSHHMLDVSNEKDVVRAVRKINKENDTIDILLNNAGIASMNAFLLTPGSVVEKVFATNTFGTFYMMREVAKSMIKSRKGRIVNFSTVAVPLHLEGEAVYAASKAAVETLTQIGARELGPYGITVNGVGPTPIATDLIKLVPDAKIDALVERQAIQRFGNFTDVLNIIEFFTSDRSSFVTGQTIYLGGVNG